MHVLVSDTSVLVDLERGSLLEASFRLPFRFVVPDLLYEQEKPAFFHPKARDIMRTFPEIVR